MTELSLCVRKKPLASPRGTAACFIGKGHRLVSDNYISSTKSDFQKVSLSPQWCRLLPVTQPVTSQAPQQWN